MRVIQMDQLTILPKQKEFQQKFQILKIHLQFLTRKR